jgi:hypothetical protein
MKQNFRRDLAKVHAMNKLQNIGTVDEYYEMYNNVKLFHKEVLYNEPTSKDMKLRGYKLMTTVIRKTGTGSSIDAYLVHAESKHSKTVSREEFLMLMSNKVATKGKELFIMQGGDLRLVKDTMFLLNIGSKQSAEDFKDFVSTKHRPTVSNQLFNIAKTGVLLGLGYILLKRFVSNESKVIEFWQKPVSQIALERFGNMSFTSRIKRKEYMTKNINEL